MHQGRRFSLDIMEKLERLFSEPDPIGWIDASPSLKTFSSCPERLPATRSPLIFAFHIVHVAIDAGTNRYLTIKKKKVSFGSKSGRKGPVTTTWKNFLDDSELGIRNPWTSQEAM